MSMQTHERSYRIGEVPRARRRHHPHDPLLRRARAARHHGGTHERRTPALQRGRHRAPAGTDPAPRPARPLTRGPRPRRGRRGPRGPAQPLGRERQPQRARARIVRAAIPLSEKLRSLRKRLGELERKRRPRSTWSSLAAPGRRRMTILRQSQGRPAPTAS